MVAIDEEKVLKKSEPEGSGSSLNTGADENRTCQQFSSSKETSDISSAVYDVKSTDCLTTDVIMEELPSSSEKNDSEDVNETFVTCAGTDDPELSSVATNNSGSVTDMDSGCSEEFSSPADSSHVNVKLKTSTTNSVDSDVQSAVNHGSENIGNTATEAIEVTSRVTSITDETNSNNIFQSTVIDNQGQDVSMTQDSVESFSSAVTSPPKPPAQVLELSKETVYDTPSTSISSSKSNLMPESQVKISCDGTSPSKALISLIGYGESGSDDDMESDEVEEAKDSTISKAEKKDEAEIIKVPTTSSSVNGQEIAATSSANPENVPVVDLATDKYRFTIDIGSGTDDSESDSDAASTSSSSSSSSSSPSIVPPSSSSDETSDDEIIVRKTAKDVPQSVEKPNKEPPPSKKKRNPLLTAGEISIEDLPPIEDLKITVPEDKVHAIGYVFNIVEQQVVVQGHHGIPPIDLDSVLFLDHGKKALGVIFDVFGHVQEPLYVVRFNSSEHIKEHDIKKGDPVFYAPETEHTSFVVIDELMRIKGSDASGLTGNEVEPCEATDFSDDEEEARVKGSFKQSKFQSSTGEFQSSRKKSRHPGVIGRERGPMKDRNGKGGFPNPFSGQGMKSGTYNQSGHRPFMKQKFNQRSSAGGPSHMQGPRFGEFGCRPVTPFPNQFEMPGNINYDMNARQYHGSPSPGYHPSSPRPWTPQIANHQFGCHTPFSNQRPAFHTENNSHMPQSIPTPPCQMTFGSGTPTPTTGEYQNFGAPVTPGPSFQSYPVNGTAGPSPGPSGFHNFGPPMPPQSPNHQNHHQNMAQTYHSFGPSPHIDISSPPPPLSPAVNGGWMPPRNTPPYHSTNSLAPPPPPPPPPNQHPPTHSMPPPYQQNPPHPPPYDYF
ncbi:H/ACA ribonucleoprotein complex non-core subunit NAF1 [Palaemon carinicauda]|uniref:H/ACA ribonucleoprotein complex non-core subunit NAF1 n=1 Tax=Palaemon carinicauda TaxID=392227 RepID=UPI0035B5B2FD